MQEFIKTAVTAAISATVGIMIKSLWDNAGKIEILTRLTTTAKKTVTKRLMALLWEGLLLGTFVWGLLRNIGKPEPPSRGDVVQIVLYLFAIIFFVISITVRIMWARLQGKHSQQ